MYERQSNRILNHMVHSQIVTMSTTGPRPKSGLLVSAVAHALGTCSASFPGTLAGNRNGSKAAGIWTGAIWNAGVEKVAYPAAPQCWPRMTFCIIMVSPFNDQIAHYWIIIDIMLHILGYFKGLIIIFFNILEWRFIKWNKTT